MIGKIQNRTSRCAVRTALMTGGTVLGLIALSPLPSQAAIYTVLYSFHGRPNDGSNANGSLVRDDDGSLYGTTFAGGPYDFGTAFKLDAANNETWLTQFDYGNGTNPSPGMIMHRGILYDTASAGGYYGGGAVIKINNRGKAALLYNFCALANCADGIAPSYGVTRDSVGNLYGTAQQGGAYGQGVVFKVDSGGNETVLYSFCPNGGNCSDGASPFVSGAIRDSVGNLYGYAQSGPSGAGVVWKVDASGKESTLHAFTGSPSDGADPRGQLIIDGTGNLFGVTNGGGSSTACQGGCGTVFKIDANGHETVLHNFTNGEDGSGPGAQALALDKRGNLYGTAGFGAAPGCDAGYGCGTAFKLSASGRLKVLYTFQGQSDGGNPTGGVLLKQGVLYGEAFLGGDLNCTERPGQGCGVVFKITNP